MKKQYTVNELAVISGVSVRTLHYYDQIGLLHPMRIAENGYRIYGSKEVDQLQQILFYRELKVPLKKIKAIMSTPDYDKEKELETQLEKLLQQKEQIELLINNVRKTIRTLKGETVMSDIEKFEGFKQKLIDDNEKTYGKEIRKKYGDTLIDASNAKLKNMDQQQWQTTQELSELINETLKEAFEQGDPASELAQKLVTCIGNGSVCSGKKEHIPRKHTRLLQKDMLQMRDLLLIMIKSHRDVRNFSEMPFTFIVSDTKEEYPGYLPRYSSATFTA